MRDDIFYGFIKLNRHDFYRHSIFWFIIIAHLRIFDPMPDIISEVAIVLNYIFTYYFLSLIIFPSFWQKKILLVVGILISFLTYSGFDYLIIYTYLPFINDTSEMSTRPMYLIFTSTSFLYSIIATCAFSFYINKITNNKLILQNEKEKTLLLKELYFFKTQFSEQVTFKFLNYCYGEMLKVSESSAKATELFTKVLSYNLNNHPDQKVPLPNEIELIQNYIELQNVLYSGGFVNFTQNGNAQNSLIAPRILITFVENAFKHGVHNQPEHPIEISLSLNGKLHFTVRNKIKTGKKMPGSGTGLNNAQQTLEMFYKDKYTLTTELTEDFYTSKLIVEP